MCLIGSTIAFLEKWKEGKAGQTQKQILKAVKERIEAMVEKTGMEIIMMEEAEDLSKSHHTKLTVTIPTTSDFPLPRAGYPRNFRGHPALYAVG
jgi:hypothetical protein